MYQVEDSDGIALAIVRNQYQMFEGDLHHYRRMIVFWGSFDNGYHNLLHNDHVLQVVNEACRNYRSELSPRTIRSLHIAAILHDWKHPGIRVEDDSTNIQLAIAELREHADPVDVPHLAEIEDYIWATRYMYLPDLKVGLAGKIIRDADISQVLARNWFNQVVCGLAKEWNMPRIEILKMQPGFLAHFYDNGFSTEWANIKLRPVIEKRLVEVSDHLKVLSEWDPDRHARPKALLPDIY